MIAHSQACTRFHIVIALGLFTLFYFTLTFSKLNISTHIASLWTPSAKTTRLIVFGDSFSHTASSRNPAQGAKWVEVLCNEVRVRVHGFSFISEQIRLIHRSFVAKRLKTSLQMLQGLLSLTGLVLLLPMSSMATLLSRMS